jgi:hypothetical protein
MDKELLELSESAFTIKRLVAIRNGKRTAVKKKEYSQECPEGYKRDSNGKCVRMSQEERRNRSISARKASAKSSTKTAKKNSSRRRKALIK